MLRWPVELPETLIGARIERVGRRAKYILIETAAGALIVHLGMSGSLRILAESRPPLRHDHFDLELDDGCVLRFEAPTIEAAVRMLNCCSAMSALLR